MKALALIGLVLAAVAANAQFLPEWPALSLRAAPAPTAAEPLIRFMPIPAGSGHHFVSGDHVSPTRFTFMLYIREDCRLPITDARDMHRYLEVRNLGNRIQYIEGCWFLTTDGGWSNTMSDGRGYHSTLPYDLNPHGALLSDGSVRITEPRYDSDTFLKQRLDERAAKYIKHMNDSVRP